MPPNASTALPLLLNLLSMRITFTVCVLFSIMGGGQSGTLPFFFKLVTYRPTQNTLYIKITRSVGRVLWAIFKMTSCANVQVSDFFIFGSALGLVLAHRSLSAPLSNLPTPSCGQVDIITIIIIIISSSSMWTGRST